MNVHSFCKYKILLKLNCSTFTILNIMKAKKKKTENLHPKNIHNYNFEELVEFYPVLKQYVFTNKYDTETVDFANSQAVKAINTALLFKYYHIKFWDFPDENLCPPIPGRVDYIHYLADLLNESNIIENIKILDIGTGATCIYPLLGTKIYNWNFVGTDVDEQSLKNADTIIQKNNLSEQIELKYQLNESSIFKGILTSDSKFTATMCNPPFYKSKDEAMGANARKLKGLGNKSSVGRNFSGNANELWYEGGEKAFVHTYLYESSMFKTQCFWYTTLVSNKDNLKSMYTSLKKLGATEIKTIPMHQGNKVTRFVAWTFLSKEEQKEWIE